MQGGSAGGAAQGLRGNRQGKAAWSSILKRKGEKYPYETMRETINIKRKKVTIDVTRLTQYS